jgi:hypothetical protein
MRTGQPFLPTDYSITKAGRADTARDEEFSRLCAHKDPPLITIKGAPSTAGATGSDATVIEMR